MPPGESLIHPITSAIEPIDLAALFTAEQQLELELGSGDGSFTLQYAQAHPGRNIVALERLLGRAPTNTNVTKSALEPVPGRARCTIRRSRVASMIGLI